MTEDRPDRKPIPIDRRRLLQLLGAGGAAWALGLTARQGSRGAGGGRPKVLNTRLTEEYGLDFPFVGAGMGFVALPGLVAAVSNAGGLGVLGNGVEPPPSTQVLIRQIKALTDEPFGVDFFLDTSAFGPATMDGHIGVCIAEAVPLVVFHFDIPPQAWVDRLHNADIDVWVQVPSVEDAVAAAGVGADAVIAQGVEAGGHNKSTTPLVQLLRDVRRQVDVPVLAAGGIATGADVVQALAHGAEGVWVGTRLVASEEAYAHAEYKRRLTQARKQGTVITTMFGPELPDRPYRVLRNRVVNQWAGREDQIPDPPLPPAEIGQTVLFPQTFRVPYTMPKFSAVVPTPDTRGDFEEMGMPAGESVQRIDRVKPAAQIIEEMMGEARAILEGELNP
jgi:NAD(P)H-dependent flavin oxidoreductase YrpB (nitropropane dioxygenase family)